MLLRLLTLDYHIVSIKLYYFSNLLPKHSSDHLLVSYPIIFQTEGHNCVMVITFWRNEGNLLLVLGCQGNLVISLEGIQETHSWMIVCGIY